MGSEALQARRRPTAGPPKVSSSQKRAHPNPIEDDQERSNTTKTTAITNDQKRSPKIRADRRAIKNCAFPILQVQSQGHHQTAALRPATRMAAGQCSPSVAASSMAGKSAARRECTHVANSLTFEKKEKQFCHGHFLDRRGGPWGCPGEKPSTMVFPKRTKAWVCVALVRCNIFFVPLSVWCSSVNRSRAQPWSALIGR